MNDKSENRIPGVIAADARDWVDRVLAHDAGAADEAAMLEWSDRSRVHADALADAVRVQGRLLDVRDALRSDHEVAAMIASARSGLKPRHQVRIGRRAFLTGVAGASAAGLAIYSPLGLWPTLEELRADYRTGTGERRTLRIASGLAVELNTRTAIARRVDGRAYRLALIAGEVAVDARDLSRPAVIETDLGQAMTANGRFSARLRDDGMCVTCIAGAVAVSGRGQASLRLQQAQQITIGKGGREAVVPIDPDVADSWRRGQLIFNDRPLSEVVAEINRYRRGRLVLTNSELGARTVNAVFRLDRLDSAPSQISTVARAHVTTLPGGIVLLS